MSGADFKSTATFSEVKYTGKIGDFVRGKAKEILQNTHSKDQLNRLILEKGMPILKKIQL